MRTILLLGMLLSFDVNAQKVAADLECRYTGKDFIYDCTVRLTRGGEPLSGVQVTVGADMPSMPMAHNVKPVRAKPGKNPGEYRARLDLEMPGEWAVKLRISGPVKDVVVKKLRFD